MKQVLIVETRRSPPELVAIWLAFIVATCGIPATMADAQSQERPLEAGRPAFPAIESAQWKDGTFPSPEALRQIKPGMDKDQVRSLLSSPHFSEGIAGVREWNYIFHFRTVGAGVKTCQYLVRFSDQMLTIGSYWKSAECAAIAEPARTKITVEAIRAPDAAPLAPHNLRLSADDLFRSQDVNAVELRADGLRIISLMAQEIRRHFGSPMSVLVRAHTDQTHSDSLNEALSLAQANAVRDALIQSGLDASVIRTVGAGKSQPLADCRADIPPRNKTACFRANRRIDIEVIGAQ